MYADASTSNNGLDSLASSNSSISEESVSAFELDWAVAAAAGEGGGVTFPLLEQGRCAPFFGENRTHTTYVI